MSEIILSGTEETLKPIIALAFGLVQYFDDKDIGQFVGEPLDEVVQAQPHTSRLKLILASVKSPPLRAPAGKRLIKAEYQIPDINPKKITWQGVKEVCGGANGFMWGQYLANVRLDNGRQMHAYGATARDAENMLERMLTLTTAQPLTFGVTQLQAKGRRAKGELLYREPTRVYPMYFYVVNSRRINRVNFRATLEEQRTKTRSKLRGDYLEKGTNRIKLWTQNPPSNFIQIMNNALNFNVED